MKKEIESIVLQNNEGQRLRIYRVEDTDVFCIGLEGAEAHFSFEIRDAEEITKAIDQIVDSIA